MNPFDSGSARRSNSGHRLARAPGLEGEASSHHCATQQAASAQLLPCDVVAPDIVAYFDGQASDEAALRARRHLGACSECARMWRDWGDARLLMRTSRLPEMPLHWPASLVQRARLQALLPTLFVPRAAPDAAEDALVQESFGSSAQAPSELHDAILALTTRARAEAAEPSVVMHPEARQQGLPQPVDHQPRSGSLLRPHRYRLATRAGASALAAWMLVLAAVPPSPPPQLPEQNSEPLTPQAQPASEPSRLASPGLAPSSAPALAGALARAASSVALRAPAASEPPTKKTPLEEPLAKLKDGQPKLPGASTVSLAPPQDSPAPTPAAAALAARAALGGASAGATRQMRSASLAREPAPRRASREPECLALAAPQAAHDSLAPHRAFASAQASRPRVASVALAPRSSLIHNVRAEVSPAVSGGRSSQSVARAAKLSLALSMARPDEEAALDDGDEASAVEGGLEHEALGVARELNDARPVEISDAMDAYAATWMDESDSSLQ